MIGFRVENTGFIHTCINSLKGAYWLLTGQVKDLKPLGSRTLGQREVQIARKALRTQNFHVQTLINEFHQEFAAYVGSACAFSFINGRSALQAGLEAIEIRSGDEVIVPGYTCIVVPNACENAGAKVVYADIELDTYGLDFESMIGKITPKTKCVILQHLFGLVSRDYDKCLAYCLDKGIYVIEDCAHALGAKYQGKAVGVRGHFGFYSFEQSKVLSTYSGGMIVANEPRLVSALRRIYDQAKFPDNQLAQRHLFGVVAGFMQGRLPLRPISLPWFRYLNRHKIQATVSDQELNSKLQDYNGMKLISPLAAIAQSQLERLDMINEERRQRAIYCKRWCEDRGYKTPLIIEQSEPIFIRYPLLVKESERSVRNWSREFGDTVGMWFTTPTHPVQREVVDCPNGWEASRRMINLPTY